MRDTSIGYDVKYNAILLAIENKQIFQKTVTGGGDASTLSPGTNIDNDC